MTDEFTVHLVDDDAGVRKALSRLLRANGYEVQSYASAQELLERHDPAAPGCAVRSSSTSTGGPAGVKTSVSIAETTVIARPGLS